MQPTSKPQPKKHIKYDNFLKQILIYNLNTLKIGHKKRQMLQYLIESREHNPKLVEKTGISRNMSLG